MPCSLLLFDYMHIKHMLYFMQIGLHCNPPAGSELKVLYENALLIELKTIKCK